MTRDSIVDAITRVARERQASTLLFRDFHTATQISMRAVLQHFDSWADACKASGIKCGPTGRANLITNETISPEVCIAELRRVAALLGQESISREQFSKYSDMGWKTPYRRFGGWPKALAAAGLQPNPNVFPAAVPFECLLTDFVNATVELHKIPTLHQLARRSQYGEYLFSGKHGGYAGFKRKAIDLALSSQHPLPEETQGVLRTELQRLEQSSESPTEPVPHKRGRHLGFRAFAFAPTYEAEVVSLFSSVADDLGFEIVAQRPAFPDCEARRVTDKRRGRYTKCLNEFEYRSRDYVLHGHPVVGCDLIVCWENNWGDSPIEVLELKSRIKTLDGWK